MGRHIGAGNFVTLHQNHVGTAKRIYQHLSAQTQLKVMSVHHQYGRKAYEVIDRPGGDPMNFWPSQVIVLPWGAKLSEVWGGGILKKPEGDAA